MSSNDVSVPKSHTTTESELCLGRLGIQIKHDAIGARADRQMIGNRTAVEVGDKGKLTETVATLIEAVKAGELDKVLLAAKKEHAATMRWKG